MSRKIGRNDPCPCGSGKKYKRCCLKKDAVASRKLSREKPPISLLTIMRFEQEFKDDPKKFERLMKRYGYPFDKETVKESMLQSWDFKKISKMSTNEIIAKLHSLNVRFSVDDFKRQSRNYISSIQLARDHYFTQNYRAEGWDEDFIWFAIYALWKRIIPDRVNIEMIDDAMQEGYGALEKKQHRLAMEKWEHTWKLIKTIVPTYIKSVEESDEFMPEPLMQSLYNWCQDFEMELGNAEPGDALFYEKRIQYCEEFCRLFPNTDDLIIQNMLRAEAESYAELGDIDAAEKLFEGLITKYPTSIWGYIGWGDMYMQTESVEKDFPNYEKAEKIYLFGLEQCDDKEDVISKRLEDLRERTKCR